MLARKVLKVAEGVTPKFLSTDEVRKIHRRVAPLVPADCDIARLDSAGVSSEITRFALKGPS